MKIFISAENYKKMQNFKITWYTTNEVKWKVKS